MVALTQGIADTCQVNKKYTVSKRFLREWPSSTWNWRDCKPISSSLGLISDTFVSRDWEPERRVEGPISPPRLSRLTIQCIQNSVVPHYCRRPPIRSTLLERFPPRPPSRIGYVFARAGSEPDPHTRLFPTMWGKNCEWFRSPAYPLGKLHSFLPLTRGQDYMKAGPLSETGH